MLQTLVDLRTDIVAQWTSLSWNEKAVALAVVLPLSFYLAKNSKSYMVNAIAAMVGLVVVVYLIIVMAS